MTRTSVYTHMMIILIVAVTGTIASSCVFPSTDFTGDEITECGFQKQKGRWWCPTTDYFYRDHKDMDCPSTASTIGGNDPGRPCRFPSLVNKREVGQCMDSSSPSLPSVHKFEKQWCPTTENFDEDGKWTYCRSSPTPTDNGMVFIVLGVVVGVMVVFAIAGGVFLVKRSRA